MKIWKYENMKIKFLDKLVQTNYFFFLIIIILAWFFSLDFISWTRLHTFLGDAGWIHSFLWNADKGA